MYIWKIGQNWPKWPKFLMRAAVLHSAVDPDDDQHVRVASWHVLSRQASNSTRASLAKRAWWPSSILQHFWRPFELYRNGLDPSGFDSRPTFILSPFFAILIFLDDFFRIWKLGFRRICSAYKLQLENSVRFTIFPLLRLFFTARSKLIKLSRGVVAYVEVDWC